MSILKEFESEDLNNFARIIREEKPEDDLSLGQIKDILKYTIKQYELKYEDKELAILDDNGSVIGSLQLKRLDNHTYDIGVYILERFRNKGYGYKAIKELLDTTEDDYKAEILKDNIASNKILEKLGYVSKIETGDSYFYTIRNNKELDLIASFDF